MVRVVSLLARCVPLALLVLLAPARAAAEASVCVLDFDNHTADPALEVLGKGLADMVVTDLAAVPGVTVVEREKLEEVLQELALQQTRFVDPATVQRVGRLVGARYAVAGSVTAVEPELRLDVRLIEVETGRVALSDKIVGKKDRLFELEAALVEHFARGLGAKAAAVPATGPVGPEDLAALLAYAHGLDLADRGDPEAASKALRVLVEQHPAFKLAGIRYAAVLKRLYEAKSKRASVLETNEAELAKRAHAFLDAIGAAGLAQASPADQARYFGYRVLLAKLPLLDLIRLVGPSNLAVPAQLPPEKRARFTQLMEEHLRQARVFIDEMKRVPPNPQRPVPWQAALNALPPEDLALTQTIGLGPLAPIWGFAAPHSVARHMGGFLILGRPSLFLNLIVCTTPTLAELEPRYASEGLALLDEALAELTAHPLAKDGDAETLRTLDLYGDCLAKLGRTNEAIAKWQAALDRFPSAPEFPAIEAKIKQALGLK